MCGEPSVECQLLCLMFVRWLNCAGEGVCVAEGCGVPQGERTPDGTAAVVAGQLLPFLCHHGTLVALLVQLITVLLLFVCVCV